MYFCLIVCYADVYSDSYSARDSYEDVLSKISELNLIAVSCPEHSDVLPFLIMEYVQIRFHFEAKRFRNDNFSKANTSVHSFLKQAKNA
jgi:hypothetical protein